MNVGFRETSTAVPVADLGRMRNVRKLPSENHVDRWLALLRLYLPVGEAQDHRADAAWVVGRGSGRRGERWRFASRLHAHERRHQLVDRRMGRPVAVEPPHVPERQLADGIEGPSGDGADSPVDGVEVEAAPCAARASPGSAPPEELGR